MSDAMIPRPDSGSPVSPLSTWAKQQEASLGFHGRRAVHRQNVGFYLEAREMAMGHQLAQARREQVREITEAVIQDVEEIGARAQHANYAVGTLQNALCKTDPENMGRYIETAETTAANVMKVQMMHGHAVSRLIR